MIPYQPESGVVVVGHGVGRVVSADDVHVVVRLTEGEVRVKLADVGDLLRAIVPRGRAEQLLERLCERCTEERSLPVLRSIRELARATLEQQVEYSRWYFRKKKALAPKEAEMMLVVSENVLAELAMSLGVDESDLRAAVKRGRPEVEERVKRVLPSPPLVDGCTFLRSFSLGTTALVGESPEHADDRVTVSVKPGAWHAYLVEPGEGEGSDEGVVLRHSDLAPHVPVEPAEIELGKVNVEGGTLGVLDEAALTDIAFGIDEVERTRRDGEGYGDRGVEVSTHGDGDHAIFVNAPKAATVVVLRF